MTLHLYLGRRFLVTFGAVFTVFLLMAALFDMLEQLRRFDGGDIGFGAILTLTALNVPSSLYGILPLIMILSAIFVFLSLARSSEMVVVRSSGRSAIVSLLAPVVAAILIGGAAVALLNPIVAATSRQYEALAERYSGVESNVLSVGENGLWLRQGGTTGQTVIQAERAVLNGTELVDATFTTFDSGGRPLTRIEAARARLTPGAWDLDSVKLWTLGDTRNPEQNAQTFERFTLSSDLTPNEIIDSFGTPSAIPIWELPAFIERLEVAGFSARLHRVWFHMELSMPLLMAAMVLVAAGFTLRHARFGRTGLMVMLAIGLGFSLYFIRNFAQVLGENGQIPVLLAAWGPPVAAVLLPLGLILHLEDG